MHLLAPYKGRRFAAAAFLIALSARLGAQTTPAKPGDQPVTLSEFTVNSEPDRGYVSSETMSGVRTATPIKDLPFSVNVLTSEFFDDFAMFELNDNISAYISSFSGLDQGGGFTLRGYTTTYQLRDGFFRLGRYGASNIDRIEVIKGPNAAVYGQSSPTGIVNMISKMPKRTAEETLSVNYGSYSTSRVSLESTGPVGNSSKNFYLIDVADYNRKYDMPFTAAHSKEGYFAFTHVFSDTSSISFQAEYFLKIWNAPNSAALPYIINTTIPVGPDANQIIGIDKRMAFINQGGPSFNDLNRGIASFTETYEKRFNDVLSLRSAANYYRARNWSEGVPSGASENQLGVITRGAQLGIGQINEDGGGFQADLLAHYFLDQRKFDFRDLLTVDINDYHRYDPSFQATGAAVTAWAPFRAMTVGQPITYWTTPWDYSNSKLTRMDKNRLTDYGTMLRHQMGFFEDRLLAFASVREDYMVFNQWDILNSHVSHFIAKATVPSVGFNYKLTKDLAAYASYSESFNPAAQLATATNAVANQRGWGYDYGIKSTLLDNRLDFTLGGYYILRKNVSVTDIDPTTGLTFQRAEGTQLFRGIEFDGNYKVTDSLSFLGSFSHIDAQVTNQGEQYMTVGRSPSNVPPIQASAVVRYAPSGKLSGLSINASVVGRSRMHVEGPNAGDTYDKFGNYVSTSGLWKLTVPGWASYNAAIRYQFKTQGPAIFSHTVALNINNVFDRRYLSGLSLSEGRAIYVTYTLKH